jgi:hypothetical protein
MLFSNPAAELFSIPLSRCDQNVVRYETRSRCIQSCRYLLLSAASNGDPIMTDAARIREHMEVIGADGVHVGTVDKVEGQRIKLTKRDSGEGAHRGHHHFIPLSLVAEVEGQKVRLSANSDVAVTFEEEKSDPT